ncbi:hypothetical protein IEO21_09746 [Rhodonia placenta]|uniref:Uncharacterized protein n=1 Tax=Rhodonia placenta TaxID=104341 RepID=A0A8H7NTR7_9APHY|nr:hypothetical protein IEO21_09746 [Postia placenta]
MRSGGVLRSARAVAPPERRLCPATLSGKNVCRRRRNQDRVGRLPSWQIHNSARSAKRASRRARYRVKAATVPGSARSRVTRMRLPSKVKEWIGFVCGKQEAVLQLTSAYHSGAQREFTMAAEMHGVRPNKLPEVHVSRVGTASSRLLIFSFPRARTRDLCTTCLIRTHRYLLND